MEYKDFRIDTLKAVGKKDFKVRNSNTLRSIYRALHKDKSIPADMTENQFSSIIKEVHKVYIEHFIKGSDIVFPFNMGRIELKKYHTKVEIVNNKIKTNYPINWKETLQWWYEDTTAKANKKLLRHETKYVFRILYNKSRAKFNNKVFYKFTPARSFKKALREKINNNEIDAFLM